MKHKLCNYGEMLDEATVDDILKDAEVFEGKFNYESFVMKLMGVK